MNDFINLRILYPFSSCIFPLYKRCFANVLASQLFLYLSYYFCPAETFSLTMCFMANELINNNINKMENAIMINLI